MAAQQLSVSEFLAKAKNWPIIDVRSPAEYDKAHIPGAVNVPLFENDERAKVGTRYKQVSRDSAVLLGLEIVGPKLSDFVKKANKLSKDRKVLVHCWRGGMRSGSFAWLLQTAGFEVYTLAGGYKAFRNFVLEQFEKSYQLQVLGGHTGSGKTELLAELKNNGQQVIDLEALAQHKGSAFGHIGQQKQPSTEQFENLLAMQLFTQNIAQAIWLEDESVSIGSCGLPKLIFDQMRRAPLYFLDISKETRAQYLAKQYGQVSEKEAIYKALKQIERKLGGQHFKEAFEALATNNFEKVALIALQYYDKTYAYGLSQRLPNQVKKIACNEIQPIENAQKLLNIVDSLTNNR